MTCDQAAKLLDSYADGEYIDAVHCADLEAHLAACPECLRQLEAIRAVGRVIRDEATYFKSPEHLLRNVEAIGAVASEESKPPFDRRRSAWSLANLTVYAAAACIITFFLTNRQSRQRIVEGSSIESELVNAHIRSLQVSHLFDVLSTDKHTVKPWFQGKLAYAPDVPNLASNGFPLLGGRLEYVSGHSVAALVYGRGKHRINVFVTPASLGSDSPPAQDSGGFHIVEWTEHNLAYWAVSDSDALATFRDRFRSATSP